MLLCSKQCQVHCLSSESNMHNVPRRRFFYHGSEWRLRGHFIVLWRSSTFSAASARLASARFACRAATCGATATRKDERGRLYQKCI